MLQLPPPHLGHCRPRWRGLGLTTTGRGDPVSTPAYPVSSSVALGSPLPNLHPPAPSSPKLASRILSCSPLPSHIDIRPPRFQRQPAMDTHHQVTWKRSQHFACVPVKPLSFQPLLPTSSARHGLDDRVCMVNGMLSRPRISENRTFPSCR